MYDKDAINIRITIDTVYGFITKFAYCHTHDICNNDTLQRYLKQAFNHIENAVLQDFKKMEKANKIDEVLDD